MTQGCAVHTLSKFSPNIISSLYADTLGSLPSISCRVSRLLESQCSGLPTCYRKSLELRKMEKKSSERESKHRVISDPLGKLLGEEGKQGLPVEEENKFQKKTQSRHLQRAPNSVAYLGTVSFLSTTISGKHLRKS